MATNDEATERPAPGLASRSAPFRILREDPAFLVVSKPPGLLTQAPPGIPSLEAAVVQHLRQRDSGDVEPYLRLPHRLDRPVSGLLVMARNRRAARRLCEQFEGRLVRKVYWALIERSVEPAHGRWVDYVRKIPDVAQAEVVDRRETGARQAVLIYRTLGQFGGRTLLEITLETGRYHQIRLQCGHHGHPVLGDRLYGADSDFGPRQDDPRAAAIALHARQLVFRHPKTREGVETTVDPADYWGLS